MPILIPNPTSTIHESCQTYLMLQCIYIHISHHNVHTQTNINHSRTKKHPNNTWSRLAPRSGWRVLLRRGLERASRNQCGISLRRDLSRPGEMFARSKFWAGRLGDPSRKLVWANPCLSHLGETGSLGRD